jgi:hypothetical protein
MQQKQELEYVVDSQWTGFWGGYGAERLITQHINRRAAEGWRLASTKTSHFLWWGLAIAPPFIVHVRAKLLYVFERPFTGQPATPPPPDTE